MRRALLAWLAVISLIVGMEALAPGRAKRPGFNISGHVTALYPGVRKQLVLRVRNPNRFTIKVISVRVSVRSAVRGCSSRNLVVGRFRGSRKVARRRAAKVRVPITMVSRAAPACQGARFRLRFSGKAVKR
jgi:hypothetical protein